jgi:hypothetical protein
MATKKTLKAAQSMLLRSTTTDPSYWLFTQYLSEVQVRLSSGSEIATIGKSVKYRTLLAFAVRPFHYSVMHSTIPFD